MGPLCAGGCLKGRVHPRAEEQAEPEEQEHETTPPTAAQLEPLILSDAEILSGTGIADTVSAIEADAENGEGEEEGELNSLEGGAGEEQHGGSALAAPPTHPADPLSVPEPTAQAEHNHDGSLSVSEATRDTAKADKEPGAHSVPAPAPVPRFPAPPSPASRQCIE